MNLSWFISIVLHAAIMFGGLLLFSGEIAPTQEGRVIPVEIISVAEDTNIRAALKAKTPDQITEAEMSRALETPDETVLETDPDGVDSDAEAVQLEKIAEVLPPSTRKDIPIPDREDEVEDGSAEPEVPIFDLDNLSALIDKSRKSQPERHKQKTLESEKNQYEFAKVARASAGLGTKLTVNEIDALQSKMYHCWRISVDAKDPEDLIVRVRVQLDQNGYVKSATLLDKARINSSANTYLKIAAERALRAVSKCAPYDFLPVEKYSAWKDMELSFRPDV